MRRFCGKAWEVISATLMVALLVMIAVFGVSYISNDSGQTIVSSLKNNK